ncbi:dephospho-CoA kinase [Chryseobacterium bernardetii]|jgi:dephospho-CoA kinase|uniref:Dephospho-CoA kinase n=3 Tax=Chryseobacterium TaxID=59732 RepID=A0A543EP10_9FLAO|nr:MULTISPECIES: dephospho-CoA kinase [Chryseobacterium]MDR6369698.1 dephospho-CoA kinase [Chryseobacterium vietnamense]MDR6439380.1 dephospho-CoA kinase [Chryseobacterium bernardetii]MDR6458948.1 dephospho-CoA kinase [Chryseobacterium vietnamense]MDR6489369.1 dephospho-CoA kinase [Chryseobacterium vietnamense]TQM23304.1 dephospho-CoA kinase [Chryseobacterium aquifrigidense]
MEELHSETQQTEPEPAPKIIGLTGGIGSGKTTVARFIEEFGFPVYYSDDRAKAIVNESEDLKIKIKELLGEDAYDGNGLYDRKFVADKVFNNRDLLQQLNEIIHPAVKIDFENWLKKQSKYLVFKETALLFELKLNRQCYKSLLVTAEDNIRIKRVMDRDNKTYREVEAVMEKQMPERDKIKMADCIIYNNTNLEELKEETEKVIFNIE